VNILFASQGVNEPENPPGFLDFDCHGVNGKISIPKIFLDIVVLKRGNIKDIIFLIAINNSIADSGWFFVKYDNGCVVMPFQKTGHFFRRGTGQVDILYPSFHEMVPDRSADKVKGRNLFRYRRQPFLNFPLDWMQCISLTVLLFGAPTIPQTIPENELNDTDKGTGKYGA